MYHLQPLGADQKQCPGCHLVGTFDDFDTMFACVEGNLICDCGCEFGVDGVHICDPTSKLCYDASKRCVMDVYEFTGYG